MPKPFDGAISLFYDVAAPQSVRDATAASGRSRFVAAGYPCEKRLDWGDYAAGMAALPHRLVRLQADVHETGKRIMVRACDLDA